MCRVLGGKENVHVHNLFISCIHPFGHCFPHPSESYLNVSFFFIEDHSTKRALYRNENPVLSICHLDSIYFLFLEKDVLNFVVFCYSCS